MAEPHLSSSGAMSRRACNSCRAGVSASWVRPVDRWRTSSPSPRSARPRARATDPLRTREHSQASVQQVDEQPRQVGIVGLRGEMLGEQGETGRPRVDPRHGARVRFGAGHQPELVGRLLDGQRLELEPTGCRGHE